MIDNKKFLNLAVHKWLFDHSIKYCEGGINWTWVHGLNKILAIEFIDWLNYYDYEHRGMYPNKEDDQLWDIRFR